jgi:hypothetical protein
MWKSLPLLVLFLCAGGAARAQDAPAPSVTVLLKDGSRLVGTLVGEDGRALRVRTRSGLELEVARDEVISVRRDVGRSLGGDANETRLLFSPTARPLRKGEGYFSDLELLFPGVAVGITDHLSIAGGMSVIPGIGLDEQAFYVAPKLGFRLSERAAVAAGVLYAAVPDDDDLGDFGVAFGVVTLGGRDKSLSLGVGLAGADFSDGLVASPIVMVGGAVTLSPRIALVSENWLVLNGDVELGQQPIGLAVRFLGDRLSADVGFVTVPAALDDGTVVPWVSVTYRFGGGADRRQRARAAAVPATNPLAHAHWKLNPPMRPSTSQSSPQT